LHPKTRKSENKDGPTIGPKHVAKIIL